MSEPISLDPTDIEPPSKLEFVDISEFMEPLPAIDEGHARWLLDPELGYWTLDRNTLVLRHREGYEVDVERVTSPASALDAIAQVSHKTWCSHDALGELVRALDCLFRFQETLCSGGADVSETLAMFPDERIGRALTEHGLWRA